MQQFAIFLAKQIICKFTIVSYYTICECITDDNIKDDYTE